MPERIGDEGDLRDHLDALNEAGENSEVAGLDATGQPFLVFLTGPYAEGMYFLGWNPWEREFDVDVATRPCDECNAMGPSPTSALHYPLVVLTEADK